jgi:methionine-rich copper-binding protein CopC
MTRAGNLAAIMLLWPGLALADTLHVRESTPAAGSVIRGDHAEYAIRFDGIVDHVASRLYITQAGRVVQSLTLLGDSAPEVLFAAGPSLPPGEYQLHWEARSPLDAVITAGDIPFSVAREQAPTRQ